MLTKGGGKNSEKDIRIIFAECICTFQYSKEAKYYEKDYDDFTRFGYVSFGIRIHTRFSDSR
jgi:hypothetical protein